MNAVQKLQILLSLFEEETKRFSAIYCQLLKTQLKTETDYYCGELEDNAQVIEGTLRDISLQVLKLLSH